MEPLLAIPAAFAGISWLIATGTALELALRHPVEGRSLGWYAVNGYAFFDPENFAESGADAHRRFLGGVGGFVGFGGLTAFFLGISSG